MQDFKIAVDCLVQKHFSFLVWIVYVALLRTIIQAETRDGVPDIVFCCSNAAWGTDSSVEADHIISGESPICFKSLRRALSVFPPVFCAGAVTLVD